MGNASNLAMTDPCMTLLLRECGTSLAAISRNDAAMKRALYAGLTLYRGDATYAAIYDKALMKLLHSLHMQSTVLDIMPIRDGIKHNPTEWPFCLTDDEFVASATGLYGGPIAKVRSIHQRASVLRAVAQDVGVTFLTVFSGGLIGAGAAAIRGSAMTAAMVMGRVAEGVAQTAAGSLIGATVGALSLKTPKALHDNAVWDRYDWEATRRALGA